MWIGQCTSAPYGDDISEGDWLMCMLLILDTLVNSTKHTTILGNTCAFQYFFLQWQRQDLGTQELLESEIIGLQEQVASFIMGEVVANILLLLIRGPNGGSTLILTKCAKKKKINARNSHINQKHPIIKSKVCSHQWPLDLFCYPENYPTLSL
jgi:hypothetical protein